MISDLGLAKELNNSIISSRSTLFGMPAFIEPQCFSDETYKRDKRSDVYSLGNLLWEIFSGYPPFKSFSKFVIGSKILSGEREPPIEGMPQEYIELHQQCWDNDPKKRPNVRYAYSILSISLRQNEDNKDILNDIESEDSNCCSSNNAIESMQSSAGSDENNTGKFN